MKLTQLFFQLALHMFVTTYYIPSTQTNTNNAAAAASNGNNSNIRAYSVQSLEQYNRSGSCTSVGSRNVQQDSIASPSITFPLPIFGSGGKSGKKRRLSASSGASAAAAGAVSAASGAMGHNHHEQAILKKIAASKKKALFYPTKKKRKVHPSASVATATTAKPRAIAVQKPASAPTRATTPVHRNAKPPKGRIEIRTVPPTIKAFTRPPECCFRPPLPIQWLIPYPRRRRHRHRRPLRIVGPPTTPPRAYYPSQQRRCTP